jgi:hypothetical protein
MDEKKIKYFPNKTAPAVARSELLRVIDKVPGLFLTNIETLAKSMDKLVTENVPPNFWRLIDANEPPGGPTNDAIGQLCYLVDLEKCLSRHSFASPMHFEIVDGRDLERIHLLIGGGAESWLDGDDDDMMAEMRKVAEFCKCPDGSSIFRPSCEGPVDEDDDGTVPCANCGKLLNKHVPV